MPVSPGRKALTQSFIQNLIANSATTDKAVETAFGMKPGLDRASILPFYTDKQGNPHWAMPGIVYDAAKALVTPSVAAFGGRVTEDDVGNLVTSIAGGGLAAPRPKGAVLTMGGGRPAARAAARAARAAEHPVADAAEVARNVGIGHNRPPVTKKELVTESRYKPPSEAPIVTQAGQRREPLGGREQMSAQHPGPFGPYHNVKPSVDPNEVRATYEPMAEMRPVETISPAALEGADVLSLYGDRTIAGKKLTGVNDIPFADAVELHGGPDFGRMQEAHGSGSVWASEKGPVTQLRKQIAKSLDEGRDVYAVYTPMGPKSLDQTTMMTDTLARLIEAGGIRKGHLDAFDRYIKGLVGGLPSIRDPMAVAEELKGRTQGERLNWVKAIDNADRMKEGFPDVGAARIALTEPELRDVPAGASGYRVVKFGPETLQSVIDPILEHGSYGEQMVGKNVGQLDTLVPFDMMFPDLINSRRTSGAEMGRDLRAFELQKPVQTMRPEVIDAIMSYRLSAKRKR